MTSLDIYDPEPRRRWINCRDRMCGATDCRTCYPWLREEDLEDEDEEEDEN